MRRPIIMGIAAGITAVLLASGAWAGKKAAVSVQDKTNPLDELLSGYNFSTDATQAMQDDDFENPAFLWYQTGEDLWGKVDGEAKKSCASCHGDPNTSMKGVGARYPAYFEPRKKLINLEQRINYCRTKLMKAKKWKWESNPLLSMTAFVKAFSRGVPVSVKIDGPAKPFFEKGKAFYYQRRGQHDMSCAHCHDLNSGKFIRADLISQGHSNGFPTYRLKWQKMGSLHRRFRGCNKNIRAKPYKAGSDEYTNLELFVAWRGNGLIVETPSVRR